jgi:hypothetical protein
MPCIRCGSHDTKLTKRRIANGTWQVCEVCENCGKNARGAGVCLAHDNLRMEDVEESVRPWPFPVCAVCGVEGAENHHFAPSEVFGDQAHAWPTAYLCVKHHREWHNRMIGYKFGRHDSTE